MCRQSTVDKGFKSNACYSTCGALPSSCSTNTRARPNRLQSAHGRSSSCRAQQHCRAGAELVPRRNLHVDKRRSAGPHIIVCARDQTATMKPQDSQTAVNCGTTSSLRSRRKARLQPAQSGRPQEHTVVPRCLQNHATACAHPARGSQTLISSHARHSTVNYGGSLTRARLGSRHWPDPSHGAFAPNPT